MSAFSHVSDLHNCLEGLDWSIEDTTSGYGALLRDAYHDQQKVFSAAEWRGLAELSLAFPHHDPLLLRYLWERHQSWDAVCNWPVSRGNQVLHYLNGRYAEATGCAI
ncbi:hypothetical protein EON64_19805 [archaeon]|nr:MAG: hypothetical protein EON64_19805 [archaeon]